jgi:hypothetical protein
MELNQVPIGSTIKLLEENVLPDECVAPGAPKAKKGDELFLEAIDGMYGFCRDRNNRMVHLKAWAEVEIIE